MSEYQDSGLAALLESVVKAMQAVENATSMVGQLYKDEANALLKRWYDHARKWVTPHQDGQRSLPAIPFFCPTWDDLKFSEYDPTGLYFERWQCGDTDTVTVPIEFFLDPDAWEAADKIGKVTVATWDKQRERWSAKQRIDAQIKQVEALRAAGWKIEKLP